jgi:tRNA 2-thiouridine synthesizing protein A
MADSSTGNAEVSATIPTHVDQVLDVQGYNCPLPILKTKVVLNRMQLGQVLHVRATDPMATVDFRAFCARTGHEMLYYRETAALFEFYIRKAAQRPLPSEA